MQQHKDRFRSQFAVLMVIGILMIPVAAAASVSYIVDSSDPIGTSKIAIKITDDSIPVDNVMSYWECWLFPYLPWCVTPPDPPIPAPRPEIEPCNHPCGSEDTCCEY